MMEIALTYGHIKLGDLAGGREVSKAGFRTQSTKHLKAQ
jgi:hypothetical protein